MNLPKFDFKAGIIIRQLENGGFVIDEAAIHPMHRDRPIAAFSNGAQMLVALIEAFKDCGADSVSVSEIEVTEAIV